MFAELHLGAPLPYVIRSRLEMVAVATVASVATASAAATRSAAAAPSAPAFGPAHSNAAPAPNENTTIRDL